MTSDTEGVKHVIDGGKVGNGSRYRAPEIKSDLERLDIQIEMSEGNLYKWSRTRTKGKTLQQVILNLPNAGTLFFCLEMTGDVFT